MSTHKTPAQSLTKGVFEPYPLNMYGNPLDFWDHSVAGLQTVVGTHGLRDRTAGIDPVSAEMARANADYWAEQGVRTIWQNDFRREKELLLDHTEEHHPAFWWAVADDRDAMRPKKQPKPAEVVSIADLRKAREEAAARAEADRLRDALTVEQPNGQLSMRM